MQKQLFFSLLMVNQLALATEYGQLNGPFNFVNGDKVKVNNPSCSSGICAGINDTTMGGTGIQVANGGAINVTVNSSIASNNYRQTLGVYLSNGVANDLGSGSYISAKDVKYGGIGLSIDKSSEVTAKDLTIDIINNNTGSRGIDVNNNSELILKGNNFLNIKGGYGSALFAYNSSHITIDQITISADFTSSNNSIITAGQNSTIDLGQGSKILTTGSASFYGLNSNSGYIKAKDLTIEQTGYSYFIAVNVNGDNSRIELDGTHISTSGQGIYNFQNGINKVINFTNGSIDAGNAIVQANKNILLNLENTVATNTSGAQYGIMADGNYSKTTTINAKNLQLTTNNNSAALIAQNGADINLTDNIYINAKQSGQAISAFSNFQNISSNVATTSAGSKMTVLGSIDAGYNGVIDLTMNTGSYFFGTTSVQAANDILGAGVVKLTMNDTKWDMTDNSELTQLVLNNSQVNFTNGGYTRLQTSQLSGNGLFNMKVDLVNNTGDLLTVTGTTAGSHKLSVTNNGSANVNGSETYTIVKTADGGGDFSLAHSLEVGGYVYGLKREDTNEKDWQLYSTGRKITSTANASANLLNTSYLLNYIDNQTLLQRLGDLRNGGGQADGSVWMRSFGGKLNSFAGNKLTGFDMSYGGMQAGIDKSLAVGNGQWILGAMVGYTKGNPNYDRGDGDSKNYSVGVYSTYLANGGFYIDNFLKYNSIHNHFSVEDTVGQKVSGTGKSQGISLSTEVGKRFWLTTHQQGYYLEPQAQLTYGYQNGDTVKASNGLKVGLSHYDSTLARTSIVAGYQVAGENPINFYIKSGYMREMSGGTSYKLNTSKEHHNFRGGWWDNGVGVNMTINKKHNIYFDMGYAKGNKFDQRQANLGYRYSF